jgi:hypothetical protein
MARKRRTSALPPILVPVLNFSAMAPVPFEKALWMVFSGTARIVGPQGQEKGIELVFNALDAAIASDKGPDCSRPAHIAGKLRLAVAEWDGNDPFEGCAAVMMRGTEDAGATYY